jgi:hypothetical protein
VTNGDCLQRRGEHQGDPRHPGRLAAECRGSGALGPDGGEGGVAAGGLATGSGAGARPPGAAVAPEADARRLPDPGPGARTHDPGRGTGPRRTHAHHRGDAQHEHDRAADDHQLAHHLSRGRAEGGSRRSRDFGVAILSRALRVLVRPLSAGPKGRASTRRRPPADNGSGSSSTFCPNGLPTLRSLVSS